MKMILLDETFASQRTNYCMHEYKQCKYCWTSITVMGNALEMYTSATTIYVNLCNPHRALLPDVWPLHYDSLSHTVQELTHWLICKLNKRCQNVQFTLPKEETWKWRVVWAWQDAQHWWLKWNSEHACTHTCTHMHAHTHIHMHYCHPRQQCSNQ